MARGGARPGAGAKPLHKQVCRMQDLNRCWDVVMEYINSDAPLDKRADLASKLAIKSVPQDINLGGGLDLNCLPKITIGEKKLEFEFDKAAGAGNTGHPTEADPDNN